MSEYHRKLVVVGDSDCGKTCLCIVFSGGNFPDGHSHIVFWSYVADIEVGGKHVALALWDTEGQEEHDRLRPLNYLNSHVIMICFAINSPDSLYNVQQKWILEVRRFCPDPPVILVGCKKELRNDPREIEELRRTNQRPVTPEEGVAVATEIGAKMYLECSALTGEGVQVVFQEAARFALLSKVAKKKENSDEY